jgi:transcriptional regulator with AAA-type ATPase domain
MNESYRGGNSRVLARQLDLLRWPIVVLDQRQQIVFVSAALCELLQLEATRLVGLSCSPALAADAARPKDGEAEGSAIPPQLCMILAPPSEVLHGRAAVRQVPWPPQQPLGFAGQAFVPLIDEDPSAGLILILFGEANVLRDRLLPLAPPLPPRGTAADEILMRLRAQWQHLDGLWQLLGSSPAIQLAMRRAQLALRSQASVWISGPAGSGKGELARRLSNLRTRELDLPASAIQRLPIDCSLMDATSLGGQLESLATRLRPGLPQQAHHLILDRVDTLSRSAVELLKDWFTSHGDRVCIIATSQQSVSLLCETETALSALAQTLATIEIEIPALGTRREDVAVLVEHQLTVAAASAGRRLPGIAPSTLELLQAYPWPGNAAEVQQVASDMLNNAVLTATIQPTHLPLQLRTFAGSLTGQATSAEPISLDEVLLDLERVMLQRAIKLSPRNRARAARLLGISRPRFLRRIAQLGLDDAQPDSSDEEE